jgi:very-short-patch-repair endonuclease
MRNVRNLNVAVSRAKEQLLVFHSRLPTEFKEGDIRRALIERCHLSGGAEGGRDEAPKTDSRFERDVAAFLSAVGYSVTTQYQSLGYRIDLVVEGRDGTRLAIECDGDPYHKDLRKDHERRVSLERVGWRFHRIWYSHWRASQESCENQLLAALEYAGVHPTD